MAASFVHTSTPNYRQLADAVTSAMASAVQVAVLRQWLL